MGFIPLRLTEMEYYIRTKDINQGVICTYMVDLVTYKMLNCAGTVFCIVYT